jgi:hypothetical protein
MPRSRKSGRTRLKTMATPHWSSLAEARHMAYVVHDLFQSQVLNHTSVVLNPEWYRNAYRAQEALWEVYRKISLEDVAPEKS